MRLWSAICSVPTKIGAVIAAVHVDVIGLAGGGSLAYGAWMVYPPAGFIVAGVLLLAGAWLLAGRPSKAP